MNRNDFYHKLLADVRDRAESESIWDQEAFFDITCELLKDSDAIADYTPTYLDTREQSPSRPMLLDGYDYAAFEQDESIVLIVCDRGVVGRLSNEPLEIPTIIAKDCNRYLRDMKRFLESARNGSFLDEHEESTPAYGLASTIYEQRNNTARYRLYFITDCLYTGRSSSIDDFSQRKSDVYADDSNVEAHVWDIQRLFEAAQSNNPQEDLPIDLTQFDKNGIQAVKSPVENDEFITYLMFFTGDMLASLYEKHGAKLMEANVRSFLSMRGKVNKGIRKTLRDSPEHFVAFNNGITATATGASLSTNSRADAPTQRITSLQNLQIVNGGQTTASLFFGKSHDKGDLSQVVVPAKVVLVENSETAHQLIPNISRFTNSQNKVAEADFSSNSEFQVKLETLSKQIATPPVPGKPYQSYWYYERTRGQYESEKNRQIGSLQKKFTQRYPKNQLIKMTDAAKYILSWNQEPDVVSLGSQKCFGRFAEYASTSWENNLERVDNDFYRQLVCKKIIFDSSRRLFQKADWYQGGYLANITAYAIAKVSYDYQRNGERIDFQRIWREQRLSNKLTQYLLIAGEQASNILTSSDRLQTNVSEWAKKHQCWKALQQQPLCFISQDRNQPQREDLEPQARHFSSGHTMNGATSHSIEATSVAPFRTQQRPEGINHQAYPEAPRKVGIEAGLKSRPLRAILANEDDYRTDFLLSIPLSTWNELYRFADEKNILSPKAIFAMRAIANNRPRSEINTNELAHLIELCLDKGYHPSHLENSHWNTQATSKETRRFERFR